MDQEELVHQIMAEVMKSLGDDSVSFTKADPAPAQPQGQAPTQAAPAAPEGRIGTAQYPLAEKHPELVRTNTGRTLQELTFERVKSGELSPLDFRISAETLELQAQVAEADGRSTLARNLRRAAELVAVPDDRLLEIYNALRPYRSTKQELHDIATELEDRYRARISAGFIREAAEVYEARGRLRQD
ncbi:MAG: diol dehydratase small subunit [Propionibacteriaceae bacterium]|nr:diol dehydratase small subunit [Propionibacteriaceae bacterium]